MFLGSVFIVESFVGVLVRLLYFMSCCMLLRLVKHDQFVVSFL